MNSGVGWAKWRYSADLKLTSEHAPHHLWIPLRRSHNLWIDRAGTCPAQTFGRARTSLGRAAGRDLPPLEPLTPFPTRWLLTCGWAGLAVPKGRHSADLKLAPVDMPHDLWLLWMESPELWVAHAESPPPPFLEPSVGGRSSNFFFDILWIQVVEGLGSRVERYWGASLTRKRLRQGWRYRKDGTPPTFSWLPRRSQRSGTQCSATARMCAAPPTSCKVTPVILHGFVYNPV